MNINKINVLSSQPENNSKTVNNKKHQVTIKNESDCFIQSQKKEIITGGSILVTLGLGFLAKKGTFGSKIKNFLDNLFKSGVKENSTQKLEKFSAISDVECIRPGNSVAIERLEQIRSNAREIEATRWETLAKLEPNRAAQYLKNAEKIRQQPFNSDYYYNEQMCSGILPRVYSAIRLHNYSPIKHNSQIDKITGKDTQLIHVLNQKGWHYRQPKNYKGGTITERISINAIADEGLIKALDDLFTIEGIKGYYKTPNISENWLARHDPITIYLNDKATPEVLQKVQNAAKDYIRSTEDVLIGEKFAPGFALEKSPTLESIEEVLARAKEFDPEFEKAARMFLTKRNNKLSASSGQISAIETVMKELAPKM